MLTFYDEVVLETLNHLRFAVSVVLLPSPKNGDMFSSVSVYLSLCVLLSVCKINKKITNKFLNNF